MISVVRNTKPIQLLVLLAVCHAYTQQQNELKAFLSEAKGTISINQKWTYVNDSAESLDELYFYDWNNAYSSNETQLSRRMADEFDRSLHLAGKKDRGFTEIVSVVTSGYQGLAWDRSQGEDFLRIHLSESLRPGDTIDLHFTYSLKLPTSRFTGYGIDNQGNIDLKYWHLSPVPFRNGSWLLYRNLNLNDQYTLPSVTSLELTLPKNLHVSSNLRILDVLENGRNKKVFLDGEVIGGIRLSIRRRPNFVRHRTSWGVLETDLDTRNYDDLSQYVSVEAVTRFLNRELGPCDGHNLLVSDFEYRENPLYGTNLLPSFIQPYDPRFQYEMKLLKTALSVYLKEHLHLDYRKERWIHDAITVYLLIKFVNEYYPDQKLIGKLSNVWGIRSYRFGKMDFNDQYKTLQMIPMRKNLDQALSTPNDSLIKYNYEVAQSYAAGWGLNYLDDLLGEGIMDSVIRQYLEVNRTESDGSVNRFREILEDSTDQNLDWFWEHYIDGRLRIDYKIKKLQIEEDSVRLTIINRRKADVPMPVYGLSGDSVVSKHWLPPISGTQEFLLPYREEDRFSLNYEQVVPELNPRNNWKSAKGLLRINRPLQLRLFKDVEDPNYEQVFWVPIANYNLYDGLTPGIRVNNKSLLERPFIYDLAPTYSFLERTFVGGGGLTYRQYHGKSGHYVSTYRLVGRTSHFEVNSRFTTITPSVTLGWRPEDLISNERHFLTGRFRSVFRNIDPARADEIDTDPDYGVLNLRYEYIDNHIVNFKYLSLDLQQSSDFTKISAEGEYRRLFLNNRQLNLRFFAGAFLRNNSDSDFFSFSLDRPTDYMFDLNYLGRSEATGLLSQQIIIAEGGFKSRFEESFANRWMTTSNMSFNMWRWVELYGDLGFFKNDPNPVRFVYDSGIRLNLVTDYFELYFPVYSNNGWEITQPDYGSRIRFVITLSPRTLTGLFTRRWF